MLDVGLCQLLVREERLRLRSTVLFEFIWFVGFFVVSDETGGFDRKIIRILQSVSGGKAWLFAQPMLFFAQPEYETLCFLSFF